MKGECVRCIQRRSLSKERELALMCVYACGDGLKSEAAEYPPRMNKHHYRHAHVQNHLLYTHAAVAVVLEERDFCTLTE